MRVFLTQNICKEDDFMNGMAGTVLDYAERSRCLQIKTRTNQRLAVFMVTKELDDGRRVACFPVRLGYACTVPKIQGMTLPHITLWLDKAGCRFRIFFLFHFQLVGRPLFFFCLFVTYFFLLLGATGFVHFDFLVIF